MKKLTLGFIMIVLILPYVLCACSQNGKRIFSHTTVSVYQYPEKYVINLTVQTGKTKTIIFSPDRSCIKSAGLNLIETTNWEDFVGQKISDIETALGDVHVDVGSGFEIPAYVTKDGYLLILHLNDGIVTKVSKEDLLPT